ncbi:FG-GAP repeat domain-containing protein [Arsenicicoccus bolidensis]|uniref:FG-GAP repeat domain-containing protein n=1 Tax=Arsenicicoccus bolidensis TaxID=229480 RepID=UPI0004285020|nr:VCBS repeat-containing protein [Arsenicicoccus bolidensis]
MYQRLRLQRGTSRLPLAVTGSLAIALAAPAVGLASAENGAGPNRDRMTTTSSAERLRPAPARPSSSPETVDLGRMQEGTSTRKGPTRRQGSTTGSATAVTPQCAALDLDISQLRDRTTLLWKPSAAPTGTITVQRRISTGTQWRAVTAAAGSAGVAIDRDTAPNAPVEYRLVVPFSTGVQTCSFVDGNGSPVDGLAMFEDAGRGTPDLAVSTWDDGPLVMQNDTSAGIPVGSDAGTETPAFSPDGMWLAVTRANASQGGDLVLRRADGTGAVTTVAPGGTDYHSEPSFSPDGRKLVWTVYDTDGVALRTMVRVLDTGATTTVPRTAGSVVPERSTFLADGITTVGVRHAAGGSSDLVRTSTATGAQSVIGAPAAYDVSVAANGAILAAIRNGDQSSSLAIVSPAGQVTVRWRGAVGQRVANPRLTQDRRAYYLRIDTDPTPADATNGDAYTGIYRLTDSTPQLTRGGATARDPLAVAKYFDLRQTSPKSTSDFTGDGYNDLLAKDASGTLWLYRNSTSPQSPLSAPRTSLGSGWGVYNHVFSVGDWDGDGHGDLAAREPSGALWLYRGNAAGSLQPRISIGGGWHKYVPAFGGDWDGDTKPDLVARDWNGVLWLYPGNGRTSSPGAGMFSPRVQLGTGWAPFNVILGVGDANYDNHFDLLVRNRNDGTLRVYTSKGVAAGTFAGVYQPRAGSFAAIPQMTAPERFTGWFNSLLMISQDGLLRDVPFVDESSLGWPDFQQHVGGGGLSYTWQS